MQGQDRTVDGRVTLRPSLPTGIDEDTGRQIIIRGELTAAEGSHVSVDSTLDGEELRSSTAPRTRGRMPPIDSCAA